MPLDNPYIKEDIKKKSQNISNTMKMELLHTKNDMTVPKPCSGK